MKKPRINKLKTAIVVQALIIGLLVASLSYVLAQSGTTFTISQGVYPGTPSYTIWREGSTYYAKNAYGAIDYSGTNASQIIQNSLTSAGLGGSVFLKNGIYLLDVSIMMTYDNFTLLGEGAGTILKATNPPQTVINITGTSTDYVQGVTIFNLQVDGSASSFTANYHGIAITYAEWTTALNVWATKSADVGVFLYKSRRCTIRLAFAHNNYGNGLDIGETQHSLIVGSVADKNDQAGIALENGWRNTVTGNTAHGNKREGIFVDYERWSAIVGNIFETNKLDGILIGSNAYDITVQGNSVFESGWEFGVGLPQFQGRGIVSAGRATIVGNVVTRSSWDGIYVDSNNIVSDNIVSDNGLVANNTYYGIKFEGNHVIITGNRVYSWGTYNNILQLDGISSYNDASVDNFIITSNNVIDGGTRYGIAYRSAATSQVANNLGNVTGY